MIGTISILIRSKKLSISLKIQATRWYRETSLIPTSAETDSLTDQNDIGAPTDTSY
jgi:hypothetical protein